MASHMESPSPRCCRMWFDGIKPIATPIFLPPWLTASSASPRPAACRLGSLPLTCRKPTWNRWLKVLPDNGQDASTPVRWMPPPRWRFTDARIDCLAAPLACHAIPRGAAFQGCHDGIHAGILWRAPTLHHRRSGPTERRLAAVPRKQSVDRHLDIRGPQDSEVTLDLRRGRACGIVGGYCGWRRL